MANCDICGATGGGTVVPAAAMSTAVRDGFDPFELGLIPPALLAVADSGSARRWAESAISGPTSLSDWLVCPRCHGTLTLCGFLAVNAPLPSIPEPAVEESFYRARRQFDLVAQPALDRPEPAAPETRTPDEARRATGDAAEHRIKAAIDHAKERWSADPASGGAVVRDLRWQVEPILAQLDWVLDRRSAVRTGLHDLVAEAMSEGAWAFARKTEKWDAARELVASAQTVAGSDQLKARQAEEMATLKQKAEEASDRWCAPGYWEQPDKARLALEAIRPLAEARDFDGALRELAALDPSIGAPLRRCAAYCLSHGGIRSFNAALDAFSRNTAARAKLMEVIAGGGGSCRLPSPTSPPSLNPSCPVCGSRHYTQWVQFQLQGTSWFMCGSCSDADKAEREARKPVFRRAIEESMERLLIASAIDADPAIQRFLKTLEEVGKTCDCRTPTSRDVQLRLRQLLPRLAPAEVAEPPGPRSHPAEAKGPPPARSRPARWWATGLWRRLFRGEPKAAERRSGDRPSGARQDAGPTAPSREPLLPASAVRSNTTSEQVKLAWTLAEGRKWDALAKLGAAAVEPCRGLLESPSYEARAVGARLLGANASRSDIPRLMKLASEDNSLMVKLEAASAVRSLGGQAFEIPVPAPRGPTKGLLEGPPYQCPLCGDLLSEADFTQMGKRVYLSRCGCGVNKEPLWGFVTYSGEIAKVLAEHGFRIEAVPIVGGHRLQVD